jgi:glucose 1-dehydrogenase
MTGRLQDRIALITGSDSGIGQATAIAFAREGADVVVHYLDDAGGAEHTRLQVEAAGRRALVVQADISDEHQVDRMFNDAVQAFGRVDVLMNNAGVDASGDEVADLATETFDKAIRTNLYGRFFCCRRYVRLRKSGSEQGGKIINVTSVHQNIPNAGGADYDCSKGALRMLTRTLALELAPLHINVNSLGPAWSSRRSTRRRSTTPTCSRAGPEHPVEARGPARGDRPAGRLPGFERQRLRHRRHLLHGRGPDDQPRPRRLKRPPRADLIHTTDREHRRPGRRLVANIMRRVDVWGDVRHRRASVPARALAAVFVATLIAGCAVAVTRWAERTASQPQAAAPRPEAPPRKDTTPPARQDAPPSAQPERSPRHSRRARPAYPEQPSLAVGAPSAGALVRGVRLPAAGVDHLTWDPILRRRPNRAWRRWGTDRLVRRVLKVARAYRSRHPSAPRVLVGDLSRRHGGDFGRTYGRIGHVSHQNGLDVDVYLPRSDRRQRAPRGPGDVDRRLAQALVDRFVAANAESIFVGPSLRLTGPPGLVQELAGHDDHLHVRLSARPPGRPEDRTHRR